MSVELISIVRFFASSLCMVSYFDVLQVLHPIADSININMQVWDMYFKNLLPKLVKEGDDGNCGSTATCDTICLQVYVRKNNLN